MPAYTLMILYQDTCASRDKRHGINELRETNLTWGMWPSKNSKDTRAGQIYLFLCRKYSLCIRQYNSMLMQTPRVSIRLHRSPTRLSPFEMPATSSGIPRPPVLLTKWLQVQDIPMSPLSFNNSLE